MRFCKVRSPQIKKCKTQTSFKIKFYIGIHLSGIDFGCFGDLSAMSPSPTRYWTLEIRIGFWIHGVGEFVISDIGIVNQILD